MSFQDKVVPKFVRVIPRGDGNDIIPGDVYELKCYLDGEWKSMGITQAKDNYLYYQNVPNTLLWLSDLTRGQEERPFLIDEDNDIEWW